MVWLERWGIRFTFHGDEVIWVWPWKRRRSRGAGKSGPLYSISFEAMFESLSDLRETWNGYWLADADGRWEAFQEAPFTRAERILDWLTRH